MGYHGRAVDRAVRVQLDWSNLTAEHERHLLWLVHAGENPALRQSALTELWESHSKLVVAIANRYRRSDFDLLDLVGAGHLGLHAAIERFDPERYQTRLAAYATGWIRWHVQDYIRRNLGPVRLPASNAHRQLARMSNRLIADARETCQRERVEPTEAEICERIGSRIGLTADEVAHSLRLLQGGVLSLHRSLTESEDAPALEETLADEAAEPEDEAIFRLDHAKARKRILALIHEILGERERIVFLSRCMTDADEMVHLDSLAARFGVSRERVYQIEVSAKRKIATALSREGFDGFVADRTAFQLPPSRAKRRTAPPAQRDRVELAPVAG
jgi:RNA polymerase sigma-32 factor